MRPSSRLPLYATSKRLEKICFERRGRANLGTTTSLPRQKPPSLWPTAAWGVPSAPQNRLAPGRIPATTQKESTMQLSPLFHDRNYIKSGGNALIKNVPLK